jgi:hypothetical protein
MDIPQSGDEERAHIAEIRAAKSLDDEASNTSDLENALVMQDTPAEAVCKLYHR